VRRPSKCNCARRQRPSSEKNAASIATAGFDIAKSIGEFAKSNGRHRARKIPTGNQRRSTITYNLTKHQICTPGFPMLLSNVFGVSVSFVIPGIACLGKLREPRRLQTLPDPKRRATGKAPSIRADSVRVLRDALTSDRWFVHAGNRCVERDSHHGSLARDHEVFEFTGMCL